jgi:hypothetical protein
MSISIQQKVDYLLKKLGYSSSKTGISEDSNLSGTRKSPFAEPIPSPLVLPNTGLWFESNKIPKIPPTEDLVIDVGEGYPPYKLIEVYVGDTAFKLTEDNTVSGKRTFISRQIQGDNNSPNITNWIDTQFGPDYVVQVYAGGSSSSGVRLPVGGTGIGDEWFFDYSSGVLNFPGQNIPVPVSDGEDVYIEGWRYVGITGVIVDYDGGIY